MILVERGINCYGILGKNLIGDDDIWFIVLINYKEIFCLNY